MLHRYLVSLITVIAACPVALFAQEAEVRFIKDQRQVPDMLRQLELRQQQAWQAFKSEHPRWSAEFNEGTGLPRRAYGDPIPWPGNGDEAAARAFLSDALASFDLPMEEFVHVASVPLGKIAYVHFEQVHEDLLVLGAKAMVKFDGQGRVIGFGLDVVRGITLGVAPSVALPTLISAAEAGLEHLVSTEDMSLRYLSVPAARSNEVHLVREILVHTMRGQTPGRFRCLVDANSGVLLYRTNEVLSCGHDEGDAGVDVSVSALAYTGNPLDAPTIQGLPNLDVTVGGSLFQTGDDGSLNSGIPGPAEGFFQLRGTWSTIRTNNVTPTFSQTLNEGPNQVSFTNNANIRERSAYIYVNEIHAHMKEVLPDFIGMDFSIPTNLDLTTDDCNAFYDGSSINFYAEANNCRSLATINDVVYHEYGHGINGRFYSSLGSNFSNGGMNEGYADVWALTLTESPVLGLGINLDNDNSTVRRYDEAPKVFPIDLTGEVHADGEIICGAWWDTYQLLGSDMDLTLDLFALAYPGLQANTFNGNEGQAFRDVLLDVLQADDDDGDITNGTPNGNAIVEGFGLHGITLISDAELLHDDRRSAMASEPIGINADIVIGFPSTTYFQDATLFYKVNDASGWTSVPMTSSGGTSYDAVIPSQPAGSIVAYYMALRDIFDQSSSITPIAAHLQDPGLPYYILVGYELEATENADDLSQLGPWVEGQPEDNATTGQWEFGAPVPSYSDPLDPSTVVQTGLQHTPGGELCWFTGNASSTNSGVGENDVDDGSTTLLGPNIDLTDLVEPAISYWRWYTNNPPSGANPNADWWQVYASADNGNTWTAVEDTKSGERNWRRKVFRVRDVLGEVGSIRLKFIASDSIRPGQDLDGGSLIEAALDDVELWSALDINSIEMTTDERILGLWPIPASDVLNVDMAPSDGSFRYEVIDMSGRKMLEGGESSTNTKRLGVGALAEGEYVLRLSWKDGSAERRFSVLR